MSDSASERDMVHVASICKYLSSARDFVNGMTFEEFEGDYKTQLAVAMAVAQAGEHVKKLSQAFRVAESDTDWKAIAGTRDWLVHDYDDVDLEKLYDSVMEDSEQVLDTLIRYIDAEESGRDAPELPFDGAKDLPDR